MKIELLEKVMHERDVFEAGDVRTVDDVIGKYFVEMGWAKDVDGNIPTGERNTTEIRLAPDSAVHATKVETING